MNLEDNLKQVICINVQNANKSNEIISLLSKDELISNIKTKKSTLNTYIECSIENIEFRIFLCDYNYIHEVDFINYLEELSKDKKFLKRCTDEN